MIEQRRRTPVFSSLSAASSRAETPSLVVNPGDRIGLSAPPPRRRRSSARLVISLVGLAGVTGGLAVIYSALKVTGFIG